VTESGLPNQLVTLSRVVFCFSEAQVTRTVSFNNFTFTGLTILVNLWPNSSGCQLASFIMSEPSPSRYTKGPLSVRPRFSCDDSTLDVLDLLESVVLFLFLSFTLTQSAESVLPATAPLFLLLTIPQLPAPVVYRLYDLTNADDASVGR